MGIEINEDLLREAVDAQIRPLLIERGFLDDPKQEGFHHQKIIPTVKRLLSRESLNKNAREVVLGAIKAHVNLLAMYESMHAMKFLQGCRVNDLRDHTIALLYAKEDLVERVAQFLRWSEIREAKGGEKEGFNATAVSYLLAAWAPEQYAFCKPTIYQMAATALLGEDQIEEDSIKRLQHCTDFYTAALKFFRAQPGLARFTDLMHCHIAFYITDWDKLRKSRVKNQKVRKDSPMKKKPELNLILFGPPGTGKTYETVRQAVEICDGKASANRGEVNARFNALRDQERIQFVTFHQSYSYEEFVEGIRPVLINETSTGSGGHDLQYKLHEGVLRKICRAAKTPRNVDLSGHRVWKMSLGDIGKPREAWVYDDCIRGGRIRLSFGNHLNFEGCNSQTEVLNKTKTVIPEADVNNSGVKAMIRFKNVMRVGDLVVISDGNEHFRAVGKVTGEYQHVPGSDYDQVRSVEWLLTLNPSMPVDALCKRRFSQSTIYQLREYVLKAEALVELLGKHRLQESVPYVLIVDEINRGNISKVFGELITLIEADKRIGAENELRATLPYSGESFGVPQNLHIIGTMNTADRSIAFLDTALRRRFQFREMMPDYEVIRRCVGTVGRVDVAKLLEKINERIELLFDRDHQIGHSYFLGVKTLADLRDVFESQVIPLLQEYFHDDWSKICHVLACPHHVETGRQRNTAPMIVVSLLAGAMGSDNGPMGMEPRFRYLVNSNLWEADALSGCFEGILNGQDEPDDAKA